MKKRIKYIYEAGDSSFLETLISAESFSDLVNKAEYIQNVHSYDREQLKEYVKVKEEVKERKAELEAGQADMEQMSADMGRQQTELQGTLDSMKSQIADFDTQLEAARAEASAQLTQLTEATENMVASAEGQDSSGGQASGAEIMAAPASLPVGTAAVAAPASPLQEAETINRQAAAARPHLETRLWVSRSQAVPVSMWGIPINTAVPV